MKMFLITVVCSLFLVALSADELKTFPESARETAGRTFTHNVQRTKGKVSLKGFRPITQKGPTCEIYSTVMILRYFQCNVIPREFKNGIGDRLRHYRFKYFRPALINKIQFEKIVKRTIDRGIPLKWGVNLRYSPIALERQGGNHARVITGYLHQNNVLTGIIYADSWGKSKNLNKQMDITSAYRMSKDLELIYPQDLDEETRKELMTSKVK